MQGTPTAPARRRLRRGAVALLAVAPLLGGLLAGPAAAAQAPAAKPARQAASPEQAHTRPARAQQAQAQAQAHPAQAHSAAPATAKGTGARTADVSVNTLSPTIPEKGDTLTITGTVRNDGKTSITDGRIGLRIGPTLDSRSAVGQAAGRTGYLSGADGQEVHDKKATVDVGSMRPGISRPFALKLPVSALHMDRAGVYQLGVTLTGRTTERPYDQILGVQRSFLPWQTSDAPEKTQLSYLWPLVSTSHLTARTESDEQQTPVFRDDKLAEELAPGGRLQQMVMLGKDLPITWVVDPDLLATVEAMTGPYRVEKKGGGTTAGKGQKYAKQWLADLQDAVRGEEVAALPFADPDLASLAHHGKNVPGALSHLKPATERGRKAVESILHVEPSTDYAWPVEGAVDRSVVDVATSAGAHHVITRSDSLRDTALSYTPTSARPVGGGTTALVADAGLSKAFEGDMSASGATSKAVQKFLAETQALTAQAPTKQRSILVAPQRMPTTAQAQAMAEALSSLQKSGHWAEGSDLSDAAKADPDPRANTHVPGGGAYPQSLRRHELPSQAYEQVRLTQNTLDDFQKVLTQDDRVITPFGMSIEREVSNSWRSDARAGENFRDSVQSYLIGLTKKVKLIQKSPITLSGRSATIPVTVQNNLVQGVDGLTLKLTSSRRIGLDVGEPKQVRIDGGHSQSVKFPATAKANGRAYVEAQLYTKDGKPYGKPMRFRVNVTSITSTVLLVIAGGVLLVVLAGVRMYLARKRRGGPGPDPDAPAEPDDGSGDAGEGDGDAEDGDCKDGDGGDDGGGRADEDAAPADGGPGGGDTGRESADPPGAGEKVDR